MSNDIVIETSGLSKRFLIGTRERMTVFSTLRHMINGSFPKREFWALKDINISVKKGEMIAIIGPNGAGKTTLLRLLAGIMTPTSGTFTVKEELSCIFELGLGFNDRFSAIENVYLYGALHGISRRQLDRKMADIADFSELEGFMGTQLGDFSSGMKARLAFATAINTVGGIVFIDEVLSVGDIGFQKKCVSAIEKILGEGHTILFISHGIGDAKRLCTRALYIEGGRQMGFGPVGEMEAQYEENSRRRAQAGGAAGPDTAQQTP